MKFKRGDLVRLKIGGPVMAVCEIGQGAFECEWMASPRMMRAWVSADHLESVEPEEEDAIQEPGSSAMDVRGGEAGGVIKGDGEAVG